MIKAYVTHNLIILVRQNWKSVVTYKLLAIRGGIRYVVQMNIGVTHFLLLMKCDDIKMHKGHSSELTCY